MRSSRSPSYIEVAFPILMENPNDLLDPTLCWDKSNSTISSRFSDD